MNGAIELDYWDIGFAAIIVIGLGILMAYY